MADFLFEIGLEEVPARMIASAQAELLRRVVGMLEREHLVPASVEAQSYATPRRLAVLVQGVAERQEDVAGEAMGPAVKIAYPQGLGAAPGAAAMAFAKKSGVAVSALKVVETPKGQYVSATSFKVGRSASDVIAAELSKELAGIYWAKTMYWRAGKPERFVRPVRWIVALLGDEVVRVDFGGYTAGRETYGHRVLFGDASIRVESPGSYLNQLKAAFVLADVELRRHTIRKSLDRICRKLSGGRWRENHALVDKMTHMTEWPSVIAGEFESKYLLLPAEVLVTVMRDHQNYFAVEDEGGKLMPNFLAVLNTAADEAGEAVIRHGNERVLRARFNDARFFWDFDQRVPLQQRVSLLENVTFQKDLGSYALKSVRVANLAETLGGLVRGRGMLIDEQTLGTAARLAKTDLTTELVKEFTELQGQVGGLYARAQSVSAAAADAIYDQYRPTSMEDRIPRTVEGQVLAIADKADMIAGMFGLGMEPTGSKDPFALRRAGNGIVKILAESGLPLRLDEIVVASGAEQAVAGKLLKFFRERTEFYLRESHSFAYDVVNAVLAGFSWDVQDALCRAQAVSEMIGSGDFKALAAAFKRMKNILEQASAKGIEVEIKVQKELLSEGPERNLAEQGTAVLVKIAEMGDGNYKDKLELMATLRPHVDAFFEAVMVMDPDPVLRDRRLALLNLTLLQFSFLADFSEIVTEG